MSLPLWKRLLFWGIVSIGVPGIVLALLEGSSSFVLLARDLMHTEQVVTERAHTNYDTLLGWVNRPSHYDRDLYGPGIYLRTNDRGFRNNLEIAQGVPKAEPASSAPATRLHSALAWTTITPGAPSSRM